MRSTIFNLYFYTLTFFVALACWVLAKVSTRQAMWRVINWWGPAVLWGVRVILKGTVEIRGREHLATDRPQMIVSKHQSELDIVMLGVLFTNIGAVAMQELQRYLFFGTILRKLDLVLVKVDGDRQGRTRQAVEGAARMKAEGRTMVIYPEGTLMSLGAKERYRTGAGHIYVETAYEAVPVATSVGVIWPRREWRKNVGQKGIIEFMEPIRPGLALDEFMAEIEERIETRTMELIRECAPGEMLAKAEDRHRRGVSNED